MRGERKRERGGAREGERETGREGGREEGKRAGKEEGEGAGKGEGWREREGGEEPTQNTKAFHDRGNAGGNKAEVLSANQHGRCAQEGRQGVQGVPLPQAGAAIEEVVVVEVQERSLPFGLQGLEAASLPQIEPLPAPAPHPRSIENIFTFNSVYCSVLIGLL